MGCCVNVRWSDEKIQAYLRANTEAAARILPTGRRPSYWDLVRLHLARGGAWDHLVMFVMVMPTFGLGAWLWRRRLGSCAFAGLIDVESGRAGCLVHPKQVGEPDCRRHAFPLVAALKCNPRLICPTIKQGSADTHLGLVAASRVSAWAIRDHLWVFRILRRLKALREDLGRLVCSAGGGVVLEYVLLTSLMLGALVAGENVLFRTGDATAENLGLLGDAFREFYRRVVCGIGFPIP
ncbi:MAG: hypothetical protein HN742_11450 [Lentisphaerae bacterium]|nr:hypothetical protein [Lentisphaerota bacterium]MBT5613191.1 hypothetical protein [Lentisphaerota bacterium]MBT7059995.1 hypothetical protein [Lentisphaerota bacterium]MBT7842482.1 hypothetical protein [Lentisphaerota bacterium]